MRLPAILDYDVDGLRQALRFGRSESLRRRRAIVGLCAAGMVDFAVISSYQAGVLRRLPDLPGRLFDSNGVNAAHEAYVMGHPDGTSGALLYALTAVLATFGGTRETGRHRVWDWLTAAAVTAGVGGATKYLFDMAFKERRVCMYCVVGAAINFTMLPLAVRELRA